MAGQKKMVEAINRAFEKTGDTIFELKKVNVHNEDNFFVPASILNDLRRALYSQIKPEVKLHTLPKTPHLIGEKI